MTSDLHNVAAPELVMASPTIGGLLRHQRKIIVVAAVLCLAAFWVLGQLDRWTLATSLSIGIALGLINHLVFEMWLGKVISAGRVLTKGQMARATMLRLAGLTAVAVAAAAYFWPDGIGVLLGLAVFRLIALVMTSVPLLKELKSA
jgi:peptidoglycan/LPS O-acetylase OafA/YrhL